MIVNLSFLLKSKNTRLNSGFDLIREYLLPFFYTINFKVSYQNIITLIILFVLIKHHNYLSNINSNNIEKYNKDKISYVSSHPTQNNTSKNNTSSGLHHIIDFEDNSEFCNTELFFEFKTPTIIIANSMLKIYKETKKLQIYIDISSPPPQL